MSVANLVIDVETLQAVSNGIMKYVHESQESLETALNALQAAKGEWSDDDMEQLIDSLNAFYSEVEEIGNKGIAISERCSKKIEALARLHSMKI